MRNDKWKKAFLLLLVVLVPSIARAQQPFVTDDADTTPKRHFHFEVSNEFDFLQRSALPNARQNTLDLELDYGLLDNVEVGIEVPSLTIFNAAGTRPGNLSGFGDANISLKYNFLREREKSRWPALALALNLELPTGDPTRQLGSGLADFYVNGIAQKSLTSKTKLRGNGGILFSGNETTGVIGIKSRGTVFTAGVSVVRQFTSRLQLGAEIAGATSTNLQLGKGQLQGLVGGNYQINPHVSFDFGFLAGRYAASPRAGVQLGLSVDF